MTFGHGDDTYSYDGMVQHNFSSNLPGFVDLSPLKNYLATRLDVIGTYPKPEPMELEALIADMHGIPSNCVLVTSGATEAIYLIAHLFSGYLSIIPQPTFSEYEDACRIHEHVVSYLADDDTPLPVRRLYWLCNPNNPTGKVTLKPLLSHLIREKRNYNFVVDQSYEHLTLKPMLQPSEMQDCHNLIILHSLTKQFCIPGLRLGYVTASPILISRLRQLRQPWSVNALAIEAGKFLIENHVQVLPDLKEYLEESQRLHKELSNLTGIKMMDSDTNFMLAYLENGNATHLKKWLVSQYGILIRDASNFHGLSRNHFRVSAQRPADNDRLLTALKEYLKYHG